MQLNSFTALYIGVVLLLSSVVLKYIGRDKWALFLLFISAFVFRIFMAHLDPFLNDWDEKFHALVARNMMYDPFTPMLRNDKYVLFNDYRAWCCNQVWLHKQPLFLWQIALSLKIFGISEYSVRYPSVLMGALSVLLVYRIALLLAKDKMIAYVAALFMTLSHYQFDLISGYKGMDHNDIAFGFYVLCSMWAYAEYAVSGKRKWVIFIGVFAGCAILNKWLTGLLIYAGWGTYILLSIRNKETKKEILNLLLSVAVCVLVALPWQLYILHRFPVEAGYEFSRYSDHLKEAVEGAGGSVWFYIENLYLYFGRYVWWLIFPGLAFYLWDRNAGSKIKYALFACFLAAFIFFSFIAVTKVESYFFVVAPVGYIFMSYALVKTPFGRINKYISLICILICGYFLLNIERIREVHFPEKSAFREAKIYNTKVYKNLKKYLPDDIKIVCNVNAFSDVELMFYNPGISAHAYSPSEEAMEFLDKNKVCVAAFKNHENYIMAPQLRWYTYLYVIDVELKYIYY